MSLFPATAVIVAAFKEDLLTYSGICIVLQGDDDWLMDCLVVIHFSIILSNFLSSACCLIHNFDCIRLNEFIILIGGCQGVESTESETITVRFQLT